MTPTVSVVLLLHVLYIYLDMILNFKTFFVKTKNKTKKHYFTKVSQLMQ